MASNSVEKYEIVEIHRSQVKNAPYNPRRITEKARKRLKENIERVGLLEPPIWNEVTGNIVGGHQRVKILDTLMGTKDYTLRVSKVVLSETEEKTQNVFLNNPDAQGEFDLDKLMPLLKEVPQELAKTGWDEADLHDIFGEVPTAIAEASDTKEVGEMLKKFQEQIAKTREKSEQRDNESFYLVVVFPNYDERRAFTDQFELEDNRYVNGHELRDRLLGGKMFADDSEGTGE